MSDPFGIVGFAIAGGAVALYRLIARRRSARGRMAARLRRMPRTGLGEVKDGSHVKLDGVVGLIGEPLVSPLGGTRCVWYEVVVRGGGDGRGWRVLARDEQRRNFWLADGQARALVRMTAPNVGAETHLRFERLAAERHPWPEPAAALVRRAGRDPEGIPYYRIEESTLPIGARVVVSGHAFYEEDPDAAPIAQGYRHITRERRLVVAGTSRVPLLVCDDPTAA